MAETEPTASPVAPSPLPVMVAVFNQKGGVGKTTTACNLSICLTAFGYRVLLVDLDTQGNATASFGVAPLPAEGTFEVITGRADIADVALDTIYEGLWLLPATQSLRDNDHLLTPSGRRRGLLEARLAGTGVDIVVVDCPPSLAAATATALASATAVLMPVHPDPFAHDGLVNTWYEIRRIRETVNYQLGVAGILMTMTEAGPTGIDVGRVIRAEFGDQVLATEIAADSKVAEAAQLGLPVTVLDPDGVAGLGYVEATREMLLLLARQNRHWAHLAPPVARDEALNRLREWRSTLHGELLRSPAATPGWTAETPAQAAASGTAGGSAASATPASAAAAPAWVLPWGVLAALAGAFAAGMAVEALVGLLGRAMQ
jgi:chromosome partitioning protein